jgi:hypothetical protein
MRTVFTDASAYILARMRFQSEEKAVVVQLYLAGGRERLLLSDAGA